jgi:hypothetical protein
MTALPSNEASVVAALRILIILIAARKTITTPVRVLINAKTIADASSRHLPVQKHKQRM